MLNASPPVRAIVESGLNVHEQSKFDDPAIDDPAILGTMTMHLSLYCGRVGLALGMWILTMLPVAVPAQTGQIESNPQANAIIQQLQRDVFVQPGRGLKRVKVGDSFSQVFKTWGVPNSSKTRGILKRTREWLYLAEDGTQLIVSGKKVVEEMIVRGSATSPYQTVEGARFGMAPYQIAAFYGTAAPEKSGERLEYPSRGVSFEFSQGALHSIDVYPPASQ